MGIFDDLKSKENPGDETDRDRFLQADPPVPAVKPIDPKIPDLISSFRHELPPPALPPSAADPSSGAPPEIRKIVEDVIQAALPVPVPREIQRRERERQSEGPLGIDIGTTNIVLAQSQGRDIRISLQLNAFFAIPYSGLTRAALLQDDVPFIEKDDKLFVLGHAAEHFANIFGGHVRRPIESGLLNPKEEESELVVKALVERLVGTPKMRGEKACFSVPGESHDGTVSSLVYHESVLKSHLAGLGYSPVAINEGAAVVLSELQDNNYTGIGISLGGGMCNVCFSYLAVPVLSYSLPKGGDYIDIMAAKAVGESPGKIKRIKENSLSFTRSPRTRIESALQVYYENLFSALADSLQKVMGTSDNLPKLAKPIPIVLSGGTVLPVGSAELFRKAMAGVRLPLRISDVRIPDRPLYATAKGALMQALLNR
jgi:hypothetical protein